MTDIVVFAIIGFCFLLAAAVLIVAAIDAKRR
jgi:hypothetical protein